MIPYAAVVLLEHLPQGAAAPVLARLDRRKKRALLESAPLPAAFVDRVIVHGDREDREAIAANRSVTAEDQGRLLDLGGQAVAYAVFRSATVTRSLQHRAMAMLAPHRLLVPFGPDAPARGPDLHRLLYPLVDAPDPSVVIAALGALANEAALPGARTATLRGYANLLETSGPDAVIRTAVANRGLRATREEVSLVAWRAFQKPDDPALLARALDQLCSTAHIAERISSLGGQWGHASLLLLAPREPLDWDTLAARLKPSTRHRYASLFAREPGCPPALRPRDPRDLCRTPGPPLDLDRSPAEQVLSAVIRVGGRARAGVAVELGRVVRDTLGDDPDAWTVVLGLLPDFTGTVVELLRTAQAVTTR